MVNPRSQPIGDPSDRTTRSGSRQPGVVNKQPSGDLLGSTPRIEELGEDEQPVGESLGAALRGSGQAIDNPRTAAGGAGGGEEPGDTDQRDEDNASQDADSDGAEAAPSGEPRTSSHTLPGNVAGTPASSYSRGSVSRSAYDALKMQLLKAQNKSLELRLGAVEKGLGSTGHRREHSDDHYRRDAKRASRREKPKEQSVTNYSDLVDWIVDCEDYIASEQPYDFRNEPEKTGWAASILEKTKRARWRAHEKTLLATGKIPTWDDFREYLKSMLSNPEMRTYECEQKLKNAKQRENQTVSDFIQYLDRLYVDLDYVVTDVEKLRNLRRKTLKPIMLDSFKHVDVKTAVTYAALSSLYVVIENTLRGTGQMKKSGNLGHSGGGASHNNGSGNGGQKSNADNNNNRQKKPKGGQKPSVPANRPQQPQDSQGSKPKGKGKSDKPKIDVAKATCYTCGGIGHLSTDPSCPQFSQRNEKRNQRKEAEKAKA